MRLRNLRRENYSDYSHGPKDNQMDYDKVDYNSIKIKQNKCYDEVKQREMSSKHQRLAFKWQKTRRNEAISGCEQFGEVGKYMENSGCGEIDPNGQNMDWLAHIMKKF